MSELKADLMSRSLIKATVNTIAVATIDWGSMARELLVSLASVGCSQFMKAFPPLFMQYFAGRAHGLLQERGVAFISGQQIVAASR